MYTIDHATSPFYTLSSSETKQNTVLKVRILNHFKAFLLHSCVLSLHEKVIASEQHGYCQTNGSCFFHFHFHSIPQPPKIDESPVKMMRGP